MPNSSSSSSGPPAVSVIVPTYKEGETIPHLIERMAQTRAARDLTVELIFMDDGSEDGSVEAVEAAGLDWVQIVVRTGKRGLSAAVIEGFQRAQHPILICMDGDLSHPPEAIPRLVKALESGQEFAVGSRYVKGGSTDRDWGFWRWLNSRAATALAYPLTRIVDPLSGFFALRKSDFDAAYDLDPVGYKIGLELIVKCGFENIAEVPIHFTDRRWGDSKLTVRQQLDYIRHIRRLYVHRFGNAMYFLQFMAVGASGVVVNLSMLTFLLWLGAAEAAALAGGIGTSVFTNFLLNRRITFSYARDRNPYAQLGGFILASTVGMTINFLTALAMKMLVLPETGWAIYVAALCGVAAGMTFNFLANRFVVFRKRHVRAGETAQDRHNRD